MAQGTESAVPFVMPFMDIHAETMIRHRHEAIGLLAKARAASNRSAAEGFEKIIREWDGLLALHGIGPDGPAG